MLGRAAHMVGDRSVIVSNDAGNSNHILDITCRNDATITAMQDAYSRIKHLVIQHAFHPGQQLRARDLADRLKFSATPVREALIRLTVEGLIVSAPHKGFYTKPLEPGEISQRYELAFMIGCYAIKKGIANFAACGLNPLSCCEFGDTVDATPMHEKAHQRSIFIGRLFECIADLAENQIASNLMRNFNDHTHHMRLLELSDSEIARVMLENVSRLIKALYEEDAELSIEELRLFISCAKDRLENVIKEINFRSLCNFRI